MEWSRTPSTARPPAVPHKAYFCLLGHLFAAARLELVSMGEQLEFSQYTPVGAVHGNVSFPVCLALDPGH